MRIVKNAGGKTYTGGFELISTSLEFNSENNLVKELDKVLFELEKAEEKHPNWPVDDMYKQHTIISEELGEVAKAILHYKDEEGSMLEIKQELRQTATMCFRMLINLKK